MPLSVNKLDGSGDLISDPVGVKETTRQYFTTLYAHEPPPNSLKPWLTTPSVLEVKARRPSPGPDEWEKWCIKSLSDNALALILDLANYEIMNARFPGDVKDMWVTMFHKRGLRTDLSNLRGLFLSNYVSSVPLSWLNSILTPYATRLGIIPETQVATQQGVQIRDVMSFLANIQCWAKRFDRLAPEGFYDAVEAYGLPRAIADLDRAAQTDTKCFIRTAYGITEPIIIVNGVTKQGGPLSPIKSTLRTSLGHRLCQDIATADPDSLTISSSNSASDPHTLDDQLQLRVVMVEATDDSYIFAKSLRLLRELCLHMERFRYAYGWVI
ncbi:hypothetical protein B0H13DRAFT_2226285 [Mycena leptocephala]|nr:hypothetical protein B0H13DRAFT_2226285 [Mycena leptocephala]